jgi:hypothetical protein
MDCREILKYEISWKSIRRKPSFPYGPTDKAKLIVAFRNFANAPKNGTELLNTLHDLTSLDVDTDDDDDDCDDYDDDDNKDDKFHFVSLCAYVRTRKHF